MGLTYRMHRDEDEPALVRLWSEHGGWDQISAETWAQRLLHSPVGTAQITVAEDETSGEIVGQLVFIPSLIAVQGQEISAVRPFAAILARTARGHRFMAANPLNHPIIAMYRYATKTLKAAGIGLVYTLPDPNWVPLLRMLPFARLASFPLWSLPLPLLEPFPLPDGFLARPWYQWDDRVDRLWTLAARLYDCSVVRDTRFLPWKIGSGDYAVTAIERGDELVGLVASRAKGDRQWLICDVLPADTGPALEATLKAVCNVAHAAAIDASPEKPIIKAAILATPMFQPVLQAIGFQRDSYDFTLGTHILSSSLKKRAIAPGRWYISAND